MSSPSLSQFVDPDVELVAELVAEPAMVQIPVAELAPPEETCVEPETAGLEAVAIVATFDTGRVTGPNEMPDAPENATETNGSRRPRKPKSEGEKAKARQRDALVTGLQNAFTFYQCSQTPGLEVMGFQAECCLLNALATFTGLTFTEVTVDTRNSMSEHEVATHRAPIAAFLGKPDEVRCILLRKAVKESAGIPEMLAHFGIVMPEKVETTSSKEPKAPKPLTEDQIREQQASDARIKLLTKTIDDTIIEEVVDVFEKAAPPKKASAEKRLNFFIAELKKRLFSQKIAANVEAEQGLNTCTAVEVFQVTMNKTRESALRRAFHKEEFKDFEKSHAKEQQKKARDAKKRKADAMAAPAENNPSA